MFKHNVVTGSGVDENDKVDDVFEDNEELVAVALVD